MSIAHGTHAELTSLSAGLWSAESEIALQRFIKLPLRMVIVQLPDGKLWLHSPIELDASLREQVKSLGEVSYLIAPNGFHHLYIAQWQAAFPNATVYASPAARAKLSVEPDELLRPDERYPFSDQIGHRLIAGAKRIEEYVFLHHSSQTLIASDVVFNLAPPAGRLARLSFKVLGICGKPAHSRLWKFVADDRLALRDSVTELMQWDFQNVVMAHGDPISKATLADVFGVRA